MEARLKDLLKRIDKVKLDARAIRYWLLVFFVLTMPLVLWPSNTEYGYSKTIYTYLFISLLVIFWFVEMLIRGEFVIRFTDFTLPAALIFVAGLFSMVNAPSKGVVLQCLGLLFYFYLIYLLIVNTIEREFEVRYLLAALILSGLGATIYGALQYLGLALGPHGLDPGRTSIISMLGNRNYLGGFISYLFVPALILIFLTRHWWLKVIMGIGFGSFLFMLFPIASDGPWLAVIAGLLVLFAGLVIYRPGEIFRTQKFWLVLVVLIVLLAYLFAAAPSPLNSVLLYSAEGQDNGWGFFAPLVKPLYDRLIKHGGPRLEDWYIGVEMLKEHPYLGIGLGNYKIKFLEYRNRLLTSQEDGLFGGHITRGARAHNEYIQIAAEMGLLGILALIFSLLYIGWTLFRSFRLWEGERNKLLLLSLTGGIMGFLVHSVVSFPAHLPASSLAFVVFFGVIKSKSPRDSRRAEKFPLLAKSLLVVLLLALLTTVSVFAYRDWRANILMKKGTRQMDYGSYRLAREYLLDSKRLDFQPRQTYYFLGMVESELGNTEQAIKYFNQSVGQYEPYGLFMWLGSLYSKQGDLEKAKANLKRLLAMGPSENYKIRVTHLLASIAVRQGEDKKASRYLQEVLRMYPDYYPALTLQGEIAVGDGDKQEARRKFSQSLQAINNRIFEINRQLSTELPDSKIRALRSEKQKLESRKKAVKEKLEEVSKID